MFGNILIFWLWVVDLTRTTGKQGSHVIKVITIISTHLLVHAQGAWIFLSKPSSFHLAIYVVETSREWSARFWRRRALGKSCSDYGKSRHHPSLITAIKTTRGVLFLMQFLHLMSPALSFLSREALCLTHLFHFPHPQSLRHHCVWRKKPQT